MTIVVVGASGNLGGRIVKALEARGAKVVAAGRKTADLRAACEGASCVVSAIQGLRDVLVDYQLSVVDAAVAAGVPRLIPSDYSIDFSALAKGDNRNFDFRREFHERLADKAIRPTSIYNGAFAEILGYGTPLLDRQKRTVGYFEDADWKLDFTTMDDTAAFTAAAALDAEAPRALHCASFQITPREMAEIAGFELVKLGTLAELAARTRRMRSASPESENETMPPWQRMQYMHSMFTTHHGSLENDRYVVKWTPAPEFLARVLT